ncbi:hypothetical protein CRG98_012376 [Punica granatum]|uniref:Uncharacterized protein n=1 Tax=Punica granatum TaxID=22663 RepID=A0A2I0KFE6_PUNGR|nr:hypothetical protein CRG98_012376 [Punica granatum]
MEITWKQLIPTSLQAVFFSDDLHQWLIRNLSFSSVVFSIMKSHFWCRRKWRNYSLFDEGFSLPNSCASVIIGIACRFLRLQQDGTQQHSRAACQWRNVGLRKPVPGCHKVQSSSGPSSFDGLQAHQPQLGQPCSGLNRLSRLSDTAFQKLLDFLGPDDENVHLASGRRLEWVSSKEVCIIFNVWLSGSRLISAMYLCDIPRNTWEIGVRKLLIEVDSEVVVHLIYRARIDQVRIML